MGPWCGQMGIGGWVGTVGFWVIVVAVVIWGVSRLFPANDAPAPRAVLDARLASAFLDVDTARALSGDVDWLVPGTLAITCSAFCLVVPLRTVTASAVYG